MTTETTAPIENVIPAVAPAPAVPLPVVVNAEAPAPSAPAAFEAVAYEPTQDVGLDMTLKFLGDLGYGIENPAMQAAINGDFSLLEAELGAKGVKGYEAYIKLGQKAFTDVSAKTAERQAKDKAAVEGIAGSPENWQAMTTWAAANADDGEKAVLQAQLGKGGLEAAMAATWLATNYNRASGISTDGAGPAVSGVKGQAAMTNGALSPKEYGAAVVVARQAHKGNDFENSSAYKQLVDRRMAFRG